MTQLDDKKIIDLVSDYTTQKIVIDWVDQQNKEYLYSRLKKNDEIWNLSYIGKILEIITKLKFDAQPLETKIRHVLESIIEHPESINLDTLARVLLQSHQYMDEFTPALMQSFKDKFLSEDNWEPYTNYDMINICKALNEKYIPAFKSLPENFDIFFNRILEMIKQLSAEDLFLVEDYINNINRIPLDKTQKLHDLAAVKVFEIFTDDALRKNNDQSYTLLRIISSLKVHKEVRVLLAKIYLDSSISLIQRYNKKPHIMDFESKISVLILKLMMDLKLFYLEIFSLIYSMFKVKSMDRSFKASTPILCRAMAFFNTLEYENLFLVEKNINFKYYVHQLIKEEWITLNRLINDNTSAGNPHIYANLINFLWCCSVFNHNLPNINEIIEYLNKFNDLISADSHKQAIQVRNWLKYEIKAKNDLKIPEKVDDVKEFSCEDQDAVFDEKFKEEVRKRLPMNYLMDYEYNNIVVDFFDPETSTAIFLDTSNYSMTYKNQKIIYGEALVNKRLLEATGHKVRVLTVAEVFDLGCS